MDLLDDYVHALGNVHLQVASFEKHGTNQHAHQRVSLVNPSHQRHPGEFLGAGMAEHISVVTIMLMVVVPSISNSVASCVCAQ